MLFVEKRLYKPTHLAIEGGKNELPTNEIAHKIKNITSKVPTTHKEMIVGIYSILPKKAGTRLVLQRREMESPKVFKNFWALFCPVKICKKER